MIESLSPFYVSFTGTSRGMNKIQFAKVSEFLFNNVDRFDLAIHGDCIGADAEFHTICKVLNVPIDIHPCDITHFRAFCEGFRVFPIDKPLTRNKTMIDKADLTLATPFENQEVLRSGTWSSIRYAKKKDKMLIIFYPDGRIEYINSRMFENA
jgi:hypothetical protein